MSWEDILKNDDLKKVTEFFESITGTVLMDRRDGRYIRFYKRADKKTQDAVLGMIGWVDAIGGPNEKKAHSLVTAIGFVLRDFNEKAEKDEWDRMH